MSFLVQNRNQTETIPDPEHLFIKIHCFGRNSVDGYIIIHRDNKTFFAIHNTCLHKISILRADLNRDQRGFDLKTSGVYKVGSHKGSIFTDCIVIGSIKIRKLSILHTASLQKLLYFPFIQHDRFRIIFVFLHQHSQIVMDIFDCFIITFFTESVGNNSLE